MTEDKPFCLDGFVVCRNCLVYLGHGDDCPRPKAEKLVSFALPAGRGVDNAALPPLPARAWPAWGQVVEHREVFWQDIAGGVGRTNSGGEGLHSSRVWAACPQEVKVSFSRALRSHAELKPRCTSWDVT